MRIRHPLDHAVRLALGVLASSTIALAVASCGGDDSANPLPDAGRDGSMPDGSMSDAGSDSSPGMDAGPDAVVDAGTFDRGPTTLTFAGDPTGIYWDYGAKAALYIADNANNRIAKWTDRAGFTAGWALPPSADPDGGAGGLGQVVRLLDGTLLVTRDGAGTEGTVHFVDKTGDAGSLGNLDVTRQRSGLAILADGTVVDSYFTAAGPLGFLGKVSLTPDGGKESPLVSGLGTPLGVVYDERKLFITDDTLGLLLRAGLNGGVYVDGGDPDGGDGGVTVLATLDTPTLVAQGPDGSVFAGSLSGVVYRIARDRTVTTVISGLKEVRGVAYDGAHTRLFVSEHDPAGLVNTIRILPIP